MARQRDGLGRIFPAIPFAPGLGPKLLALLPALCLVTELTWGRQGLMAVATAVPLLILAGAAMNRQRYSGPVDCITNLPLTGAIEHRLDRIVTRGLPLGRDTACLAIGLDDAVVIERRFGSDAMATILRHVARRLPQALRPGDLVARQEGHGRFVIALAPSPRLDLEAMVQISARIQRLLAEPISTRRGDVIPTISIGFCTQRQMQQASGIALTQAALAALSEATANGPGAIRAWGAHLEHRTPPSQHNCDAVREALELGQIKPWFQPQISTETGEISGAEALARWEHPGHGILPPGEFLPAIEASGLSAGLREAMLTGICAAIRSWDEQGLHVPQVALNLSTNDLCDPTMPDRIAWELDRHELSADRLVIEVLEDVIAGTHEDMITRNVAALSDIGCRIELDDFGTGSAAIGNIRLFSVSRIKIDRSFVTHIDTDRSQQDIVTAILTMADRLSLGTVAEGVETAGEHAILSQLGCDHVQGFRIGRPMPASAMVDWLVRHNQRDRIERDCLPTPRQAGRD